jgi:hypothetical protein
MGHATAVRNRVTAKSVIRTAEKSMNGRFGKSIPQRAAPRRLAAMDRPTLGGGGRRHTYRSILSDSGNPPPPALVIARQVLPTQIQMIELAGSKEMTNHDGRAVKSSVWPDADSLIDPQKVGSAEFDVVTL